MIPYCEVVSQPRLTYSINFSLEYLTEFPIFKQGITPFLVRVHSVLGHTPKSLLASSDRTVSDSILSTMEIPFQLKISTPEQFRLFPKAIFLVHVLLIE